MDRKTYMKEIYSTYWSTAREKIYGFLDYDKNLCNYICDKIPRNGELLEIAIGTGYPFADFFQKTGYTVYGIDISPDLIEKCKQLYPNIHCKVGDAEELDYPDSKFDCTYCIHSSWLFPDLNKAIDEMLRVTRPGGLVIFDLQNRNNPDIDESYRKNLFKNSWIGKGIRVFKNIGIVILHRGKPNWIFVVHEVPTYPESIYEYIEKNHVSDIQILVKREDESLEIKKELCSFKDYPRLVFVLKKNNPNLLNQAGS